MRIIVKNVDKLNSSTTQDKVINEYLVYVMCDDIAVECHHVFGDSITRTIKSLSDKYKTQITTYITMEEFLNNNNE